MEQLDSNTRLGEAPTVAAIEAASERLKAAIVATPTLVPRNSEIAALLGANADLALKLELFQRGGSFKIRAAILAIEALPADQRARGVITASGGNHAIALAEAGAAAGVPVKVCMSRHVNPFRRARCEALGAQLVLVETVHEALDEAQRISDAEGLAYVHPFEGPTVSLGTATLGLEFWRQAPPLDAVIVPIGGGGLASGVASAIKQLAPQVQVFGVEPHGADTMHRSFAQNVPARIESVRTIADSLGAPLALPYSFALCRRYVDELVMISDDQMRWSMRFMLEQLKLAVEPAGAAAMSALLGPLRQRLQNKRVGIVVCGANVDADTYMTHIGAASRGPIPAA